MLFGASGSYKSFIALDFALHIASGRPWHNLATASGTVVYIAAEGATGLALRRRAWEQRHETEVGERFLTLEQPINLASASDVDKLIASVQMLDEPPVLVVVDTLSRCTPGVDENLPSATSLVVTALDRVRQESGAMSVLVIHHTAKGKSDSPRGNTGYPAAMDSVLSVRKASKGAATLGRWKERDADDKSELHLRLDTIVLPSGETSLAVGYSDAHDQATVKSARNSQAARSDAPAKASTRIRRDAVYEALKKTRQALAPKEVAVNLKRPEARKAVHGHLTILVKEGRATRDGEGRYRAC
jgi:hypothetical protein